MSILKTAQDVRALRNNQRAAAISGDHRSAWELGPDVQHHMTDLARQYVYNSPSMVMPDHPVGRLVVEIACAAALAAPDLDFNSDMLIALRTANRLGRFKKHEAFWVKALREAQQHLPNIELVSRRLKKARNIR